MGKYSPLHVEDGNKLHDVSVLPKESFKATYNKKTKHNNNHDSNSTAFGQSHAVMLEEHTD